PPFRSPPVPENLNSTVNSRKAPPAGPRHLERSHHHRMKNYPRLINAGLVAVLLLGSAGAADRLLIKNGLLMTMAPGQDLPFTGYIAVGENGKISAVGAGVPPATLTAAMVYDAGRKYILPGFVSA